MNLVRKTVERITSVGDTYPEGSEGADDASATVLYEGAGYDLKGASHRSVWPLLHACDALGFFVKSLHNRR